MAAPNMIDIGTHGEYRLVKGIPSVPVEINIWHLDKANAEILSVIRQMYTPEIPWAVLCIRATLAITNSIHFVRQPPEKRPDIDVADDIARHTKLVAFLVQEMSGRLLSRHNQPGKWAGYEQILGITINNATANGIGLGAEAYTADDIRKFKASSPRLAA